LLPPTRVNWGIDVMPGISKAGRRAGAKYFIGRGAGKSAQGDQGSLFQSAVRNLVPVRLRRSRGRWACRAKLGPGATRWWQGWGRRENRPRDSTSTVGPSEVTEELRKPEAAHVRHEYIRQWSPPRGERAIDGGRAGSWRPPRAAPASTTAEPGHAEPQRSDLAPAPEIYVRLEVGTPRGQSARDTPADEQA